MPKVFVLSGHDVGKSFDVGAGAVLGRAEECAARLTDPSVSRHHARLDLVEGRFWIADTRSRNGLRVGAQRVERAPLGDGDEFQLGEVLLRFRADIATGERAAQPAPSEEVRAEPRTPAGRVEAEPADEERLHEEVLLEGDWSEPAARPAPAMAPGG